MNLQMLLSESKTKADINNTRQKKERWMRLPYLGPPSEKLAAELRRYYGDRTAFYPVSTIRQLISIKDPVPATEKSGVYQIKFRVGCVQ